MSSSCPKNTFPDQNGSSQQDKCPRRLSFSGIFRSSRDSNQQPSSSPASIKLFNRIRRDKTRAHSFSSPPPPPPPPAPPAPPPAPPSLLQEELSVFQLETYVTEPRRLQARRLRSFSSPPDTSHCSSTASSYFRSPPLAPPLPVGRQVEETDGMSEQLDPDDAGEDQELDQ